jgi:acetylornithine/N-succinyldiaminopimelate aminotransferase
VVWARRSINNWSNNFANLGLISCDQVLFPNPEWIEMSEADGPEITRDDETPAGQPKAATREPKVATRDRMSVVPRGLRRADAEGVEIVDAMAGRASVFGFGFGPVTEAIQTAAESYLGDGAAFNDQAAGGDGSLRDSLMEVLGETSPIAVDSIFLRPSADMAVETAVGLARRCRPEKSYRTISLLDSNHGRTLMCRTASGCPELHEGFGPMMAGFTHVPAGDLDAIAAAVDEQTACILLSPIRLQNAAQVCDPDYLLGLREICDQHQILLVVDETQLTFGSSGRPLAFSAIADVQADIVTLAGGLFAGFAGGIVLASQEVTGQQVLDTGRYPLQAAVASETLRSMLHRGLPESASDSMQKFVLAVAEQLRGFEFVRDVNVLGMTIGIETDVESASIVQTARSRGLRIEPAGETAIRIQPPLVMSDDDREALLTLLGETIEAVERETANIRI